MFLAASIVAAVTLAQAPESLTAPKSNERVRITVMPPLAVGVAQAAANAIEPMVVEALAKYPNLEVLGLSEVNALLGVERAKDAVGCTDVVCASELAMAIGTPYVVTGTVHPVDGVNYLSLVLLDSFAQKALARSQQPLDGSGDAATVRRAIAQLLGRRTSERDTVTRLRDRWRYLATSALSCGSAANCLKATQERVVDIERVLRDPLLDEPRFLSERTALIARRNGLVRKLENMRRDRQEQQTNPTTVTTPRGIDPSRVAETRQELARKQQELAAIPDTYFNRDARGRLTAVIHSLQAKLALYSELDGLLSRLRSTSWNGGNKKAREALEQRVGEILAQLNS